MAPPPVDRFAGQPSWWRAAWGELWRPGAAPALDGWRALAITWVLLFHGLFYARPVLTDDTVWALVADPALYLIWEGDFGVDIFFVLSGLLIGRGLIVERDSTGGLRLGRFYARRALRLLPAYWVALALTAVFVPGNRANAWANLLYVNNLLPFEEQFMAWSWSLAIEEQFYLVFPVVLLGVYRLPIAARGPTLAGIGLTAIPISAWLAHDAGIQINDLVMIPIQPLERWVLNFDILYDKPWTRGAALFAGVTLAWVRERILLGPRAANAIAVVTLLGAPVVIGWALRVWPGVYTLQGESALGFIATHRVAFAIAVAALMGISLHRGGIGRALGKVAGLRMWTPISRLAYCAYLINPIVALGVWERLDPGEPLGEGTLVTGMLATLAGTLVAAFALFALVEQPVLRLRNRRFPGSARWEQAKP